MAKRQVTTWNREDRDLLVELRTRLISVEASMQEVKTGITARLLNLEANAVSKVEVQALQEKLQAEIDANLVFRSQVKVYGSLALVLIGFAEFMISHFFK